MMLPYRDSTAREEVQSEWAEKKGLEVEVPVQEVVPWFRSKFQEIGVIGYASILPKRPNQVSNPVLA